MENLIILGTSHIARESLNEVRRIIEEEKPDIIALELDRRRMFALLHKEKSGVSFSSIRKIGVKGFGFALFGSWASKKLGELVGVTPGSEMATAMRLAKKSNIPVVPIDQEIEITLKKFSKALSWKERWNFVKDIFSGIFRKEQLLKKYKNLDLSKVPEESFIKEMIGDVKIRYPNIYRVLIEERNNVMAKRIAHLMIQHPGKKVFAIVGAGHKDGILELLDKKEKNEISYSFEMG
jgi:pheromone shutdown-related protein TraB